MAAEYVEFDGGYRLLGAAFLEIGSQKDSDRKAIDAKLVQPLEFKVPPKTEFVHVAFRTVDMCFGTFASREARRIKSVYFDLTNQDFDNLKDGIFRCDLYAHLESGVDDDEWTPYFIVEALFFGPGA